MPPAIGTERRQCGTFYFLSKVQDYQFKSIFFYVFMFEAFSGFRKYFSICFVKFLVSCPQKKVTSIVCGCLAGLCVCI